MNETTTPPIRSNLVRYRCKYCSTVFEKAEELIRHKKQLHVDEIIEIKRRKKAEEAVEIIADTNNENSLGQNHLSNQTLNDEDDGNQSKSFENKNSDIPIENIETSLSQLKLQCSTLGHLTAVYCVLFDVTGKYIFTGADDHLVKVWSAIDGRLLTCFRGNSAEITDLAVNRENTLLASSSCDRRIRIWCLATGAPVATLTEHAAVTRILFCPMPKSRSKIRYLTSTSIDGSVSFWAYVEIHGKQVEFLPNPTSYLERNRPGLAEMCSSFSSGGIFLAAGSVDNNVRVYHMLESDGPKRVLEVQCHNDLVRNISWAHRGVRFISGSYDGTALVWTYDFGDNWRFTKINAWKPLPGDPQSAQSHDPKLRSRVTMVAWNADDTLVLTAVSNHLVKVWNPENAALVRILRDHTDEVFVVEPHPIYPRVVCTAGLDGQIFVWDIGDVGDMDLNSGRKVFEHKNVLEEGQGDGSVFDVKWSPDGLSLAATDSHGHLLIFTCAANDKFQTLPKELFFHTDYHSLTTDPITNIVLDEQTQVYPHLMPPPFLVNMDGARYPAELQRLVPGRENCEEEQLIPNVAVASGGQADVIEGLPSPIGNNARSNIDEMIAQLAAVQEGANRVEQRGQDAQYNERLGVVHRRDSQAGGVYNNKKRIIIPPLSPTLLKRSEEIRYDYGKEEEDHYQERKVKSLQDSPAPGNVAPLLSRTDSIAGQEIRSKRLRRMAAVSSNSSQPKSAKTAPRTTQHHASVSSKEEDKSDHSDEDNEDPRPGPLPQITKQKQETKPKPSRKQRKIVDESQLLDGIPPIYRPSEWFASQKPCNFPYWPQIGDEVVYFRQGHERYINAVINQNTYTIDNKSQKQLPWKLNPNLGSQVACRVTCVKFEIVPPRLVTVRLEVVDWENGEPSGTHINVTYHDMIDVVDFIILKQLHDKSMRHNWSVKNRFRCLITNIWYLGTITSVVPYSSDFPNSKFLLYKVRWDNCDNEVLSPWDIEVIPDAFEIPDDAKANGILASDEDVRAGLYGVQWRDWPPYGHQEAECDRISTAIGEVMSLGIAESFLTPVDLNKWPDYAYDIAYPMDLSTIKARLDNRFYRRLESVKFDIKYICINTEIFNRSKSEIVKKSRIIRDLCLLICSKANVDVNAEYQRLQRTIEWQDGDVDEEGRRRTIRRQNPKSFVKPECSTSCHHSTGLKERESLPKKKRPDRAAREDGESCRPWDERCVDLLNKLWHCRDAAPFREPVDIVNYPDYFQQIDTPMDLQSIREDLRGGNYSSPLQFSKDIQLIFSNSKQYNTDKHSPIHLMTLRLKSMFDCQIRPILEDWKRNSSKRTLNKP